MANACGELQGLEVAIVGASIGGLGCANVLLQLGASVSVVERYSRGFGSRGGGINADAKLLMEITQQEEPPKRLPGGGGFYYGDVWSYLNQALPVNTVRYGIEISEIEDVTSNRPALVVDGAREEYDLIICADGGWSTLRRYVTDVTPTYAGYVLWRGLVDLSVVHGFKSWGTFRKGNITTSSYPVRGPGRSGVYLQCGVYIAQPEAEIYRPSRGANRMVQLQYSLPAQDRPRQGLSFFLSGAAAAQQQPSAARSLTPSPPAGDGQAPGAAGVVPPARRGALPARGGRRRSAQVAQDRRGQGVRGASRVRG